MLKCALINCARLKVTEPTVPLSTKQTCVFHMFYNMVILFPRSLSTFVKLIEYQ